jgi:hypothetical protein
MTFPDRYLPPFTEPPPFFTDDDMAKALGLTLPVAQPLAGQISLAAAAVYQVLRTYCGRSFTQAAYVEHFPREYLAVDYVRTYREQKDMLLLTETPVKEITALRVGSSSLAVDSVQLHHSLGRVFVKPGQIPADGIEVEYVGGYNPLPPDLGMVTVDLVRRQLSAMGVSLGAEAGAPIRGVSIGNLRVEYAVSLTSEATRGVASPLTEDGLKPFLFILDLYRTHRTYMSAR